eukprot:CAMPEP_0118943308 /NCGR_PEP_ID=MMETSP1169-20130426/38063_1 /TAXON_ID=36882 /ORGANISM="Pyramimonas obovata, Strain CCMP722" /LENGTH=31 /DNA_ID= /DNA_START= /DNA_END= /DNA_ORIENTATION=
MVRHGRHVPGGGVHLQWREDATAGEALKGLP